MDHHDEDERSTQVGAALLKAFTFVVVVGLVIALGTIAAVRLLGLHQRDSSGPVGTAAAPRDSTKPLPTTALPVPGGGNDGASTETFKPKVPGKGDIQLEISPTRARPMERVNLTGRYRGVDSVDLQVQRFEDGGWRDFGVQVPVRVGTFATYVQTGRPGEQRFRMFDPRARQGSNVVLVTIG